MKNKHFTLTLLLLCLLVNHVAAQHGRRFADPIFGNVTVTKKIRYSQAVRMGDTNPTTLYFDFYEPANDTIHARPMVITMFGGSFVVGSRDYKDMVEYCTRFAKHGYVAASIDYRLLYLWQLSASSIKRDGYMAAQDLSAAVRYFKAHCDEYRIDTSNIYLLGNSAGSVAILAEMFMEEDERPEETLTPPDLGTMHSSGFEEYANYSSKVAGAIPQWGGVIDLYTIDQEEYAPLCLIHGTSDGVIPIDSGYCYSMFSSSALPYLYGSHAIATYLDKLGIDNYEYHPFEHEGHSFYLTDNLEHKIITEKFNTCFNIVRDFLLKCQGYPIISDDNHVNITIFPNPATDAISISNLYYSQDEPCQMSIFDVHGREIYSKIITETDPIIDISHLKSGVYLIQLEQNGKYQNKKFIKQ